MRDASEDGTCDVVSGGDDPTLSATRIVNVVEHPLIVPGQRFRKLDSRA